MADKYQISASMKKKQQPKKCYQYGADIHCHRSPLKLTIMYFSLWNGRLSEFSVRHQTHFSKKKKKRIKKEVAISSTRKILVYPFGDDSLGIEGKKREGELRDAV